MKLQSDTGRGIQYEITEATWLIIKGTVNHFQGDCTYSKTEKKRSHRRFLSHSSNFWTDVLKKDHRALTGVAQLAERHSAKQEGTGLIPG